MKNSVTFEFTNPTLVSGTTTKGLVPGIDSTMFQQIAQQAEVACPVSNALREGIKIELEATLAS